MSTILIGISVPLINFVLLVAAVGGVLTLMEQIPKIMALRSKRLESKRELQAQFAEFLKTQPKTQTKSSR